MNKFPYPRDGSGFWRARQEEIPLPAMRSRPRSLPFLRQAWRLAQLSAPMKPFLIDSHQILETELTYSQQRRNYFLIGRFSTLSPAPPPHFNSGVPFACGKLLGETCVILRGTMSVIISMLRGVNVGGHNKIKMDELRAVYQSLGLRDAQTYIQSGNVVCRAEKRELATVCTRIEKGIERNFGIRPSVIVRTAPELREVMVRNPFAKRSGIDASRLLVAFLASSPAADALDKVLKIKCEPEELRVSGRELFIYFPNGMARPTLSLATVERTLKIPSTGRNWNTVRKLLEMAEALEAAG